ncbi:hypothetical protein CHS0354_035762 [Potamilus streckersoni]|uniref:Uncharacterized protein n=1 Tax=Potamilus streckersoni TaxID=2493646 RepID=A0AAE0S036_9BIVA|nr:hypothetical protein CHS0354_035762 [Potamilus streckersoni]
MHRAALVVLWIGMHETQYIWDPEEGDRLHVVWIKNEDLQQMTESISPVQIERKKDGNERACMATVTGLARTALCWTLDGRQKRHWSKDNWRRTIEKEKKECCLIQYIIGLQTNSSVTYGMKRDD